MNIFNIKSAFWQMGSNTSQFWSSAANAYVSPTSATYLAFVAAGNSATVVTTVGVAMAAVINQFGVLDESDTTMHRVCEAVALGLNSWTGPDVVAFVNYRRALRAIVDGSDTTSTSIPAKPAYPTGT